MTSHSALTMIIVMVGLSQQKIVCMMRFPRLVIINLFVIFLLIENMHADAAEELLSKVVNGQSSDASRLSDHANAFGLSNTKAGSRNTG